MFHGRLDHQTASGLKVLRSRIDNQRIPKSVLDETIVLATWNIRDFGKSRRTPAAIHYIAEILAQFDLIAITELRDNITDLKRVMDILGPYWRVVYSDFNTDAGGNRERIAFLYDERAVSFTGLAAEPDPPRKKDRKTGEYLPTLAWWRSPFMASFRAGNFDFILLAAHIRWGSGAAARLAPLQLLANWVDKRSREKHVIDKDFIILGDFNIPSVTSKLYAKITKKGLEMPRAFLNVANESLCSNLARNKRYDQILHNPKFTKSFTGRGGVLDFYQGNWRSLFPAERYPDMSKSKFTFQLSDHLPLWIEIDTWIDDERLNQVLNRSRRRSS